MFTSLQVRTIFLPEYIGGLLSNLENECRGAYRGVVFDERIRNLDLRDLKSSKRVFFCSREIIGISCRRAGDHRSRQECRGIEAERFSRHALFCEGKKAPKIEATQGASFCKRWSVVAGHSRSNCLIRDAGIFASLGKMSRSNHGVDLDILQRPGLLDSDQ